MSGDSIKAAIEAMKAEKARLLEQASAEIDRAMAADMAELERLAAKYNLRVVGNGASTTPATSGSFALASTVVPLPPEEIDISVHVAGVQTLAELVAAYRADERSPYRALRFKVRESYDNMIDRIVTECGSVKLSDLTADGIQKLYDGWAADGKVATGHALATKLRLLFSFGTTVLDDPGCQRLSTIMNRMRFENPKPRSEQLTAEHVEAIRAKAHELGKPSIALAQAIQYQLMLNQKDVIGEWLPATEPGESDIVLDGLKWLHGIRWSEIDNNLILRHVTSFRKKMVEIDLKRAPMVLEELKRVGPFPKKGPVIVSEWSQKPWSSAEFRRWWRKIADASGVPKNIRNMDSSKVGMQPKRESVVAAETLEEDTNLSLELGEARLH
jgi:hypothetical protein